MAQMSDLLVVELPVVTAALLGGLGWATRVILDRIKTYGDWMIQSRAEHQDYDRDLAELRRTVPQVKEDLAVVTAQLDDHLRWHERHPTTDR